MPATLEYPLDQVTVGSETRTTDPADTLAAVTGPTDGRSVSFEVVKADVLNMIEMVNKHCNAGIDPADYPAIEPAQEGDDTSFYRPKGNVIRIHGDHYGLGFVYAEEVTHWLREQLRSKEDSDLPYQVKGVVDEFFGRLGEDLLIRLLPEEDLKRLFPGEVKRRWASTEKVRGVAEQITDIRTRLKVSNKFTIEKPAPQKLWEAIEEFQSLRIQWLIGEIDQKGFQEKLREVVQGLASIKERDKDEDSQSSFLENSMLILTAAASENTKELVQVLYQMDVGSIEWDRGDLIDDAISRLYRELSTHQVLQGVDNTMKVMQEALTELEIENLKWHVLGYAAAELFIAGNANWLEQLPQLLKMSSEEVGIRITSNEEASERMEAILDVLLESEESLDILAAEGQEDTGMAKKRYPIMEPHKPGTVYQPGELVRVFDRALDHFAYGVVTQDHSDSSYTIHSFRGGMSEETKIVSQDELDRAGLRSWQSARVTKDKALSIDTTLFQSPLILEIAGHKIYLFKKSQLGLTGDGFILSDSLYPSVENGQIDNKSLELKKNGECSISDIVNYFELSDCNGIEGLISVDSLRRYLLIMVDHDVPELTVTENGFAEKSKT